jgi:hypothetical protein
MTAGVQRSFLFLFSSSCFDKGLAALSPLILDGSPVNSKGGSTCVSPAIVTFRWLVELDIRAIKVTLGMDVLRCQWPAMIHCEIWTCLLAYNLIRQTMLEAAIQMDRSPRQFSFTAALQKIATTWATLATCEEALLLSLIEVHLNDIATNLIGKRPDRVEPRAVKRRPKAHKLLTTPRKEAQTELLSGVAVERNCGTDE